MTTEYHRVLFIFVDGVGLAPASENNPLATAPMPAVRRLLGGPLTAERATARPDLLLKGIDARLGVDGLPQSASGQTALLTGVNGAEVMGRHMTALPGPTLRAVIEKESLFLKLTKRGLSPTFANAYNHGYLEKLAAGTARASATTLTVSAADVRLRLLDDLDRGAAVTWDIERDLFAERAGVAVPPIGAAEAGAHLAALARRHDLTLFETFLTDVAGHRRWGMTADEALRRVDGLLAGVLEGRSDEVTVLLTSDHGNVEEASSRAHTLNPVPLLVIGPLAGAFADLGSILEVTPRLVELLAPEVPT